MAQGSTQPLIEIFTINLLGVKLRGARKADNLTVTSEPIISKIWEPRRLTNLWASRTCSGIALPYAGRSSESQVTGV
jgi:hypothetical protein